MENLPQGRSEEFRLARSLWFKKNYPTMDQSTHSVLVRALTLRERLDQEVLSQKQQLEIKKQLFELARLVTKTTDLAAGIIIFNNMVKEFENTYRVIEPKNAIDPQKRNAYRTTTTRIEGKFRKIEQAISSDERELRNRRNMRQLYQSGDRLSETDTVGMHSIEDVVASATTLMQGDEPKK